MLNHVAPAETADPAYTRLYTLGSVAAWIAAVLIVGEVLALAVYPQPGTIRGWFLLFQRNPIIGLVDFWGLEVLLYAMFTLVFLALYVALRRFNPSRMLIALTLAVLGIGIFFATNNPFAMLTLSDQYAAATTDAERSLFLAAGQALLANTNQRAVGGFNLGLLLVSAAGLIVASVMFQQDSFSSRTAWVGIVAHALSVADYLRQALTSSTLIALLLILPNALFLVLWYASIGRWLYRRGRLERPVRSSLRSTS
ncbi:MAG TPA: DUF4386 family protein [Herpetosiphonaceae bacterium]